MKMRIYVQPAESGTGGMSYFQDVLNATESHIPNVGDTVQLNTMSAPEIVKARHYKWHDPDFLEVRLDV